MIVRVLVAGLLALAAQPALGCSGPGPIGHAIEADVVVNGRLLSGSNEIVTTRILKGPRATRYAISWPPWDPNDECAFLGPSTLDRGIYFLKRTADGRYVVMWTERRWDRRWDKYLTNREAAE